MSSDVPAELVSIMTNTKGPVELNWVALTVNSKEGVLSVTLGKILELFTAMIG